MPCVNIDIVAGRTPEQKKAAADVITHALVDYCVAHAEHVYVIFHDIAGSDWVINGKTVAERMSARGES